MTAKELVEKIDALAQYDLTESAKEAIESLLETALGEAFSNGRLDAQYDNDTLPEQIEAHKRQAVLAERERCVKIIKNAFAGSAANIVVQTLVQAIRQPREEGK